MSRFWNFVYLAGAILCVVSGYRGLDPALNAQMSTNWTSILITFVSMCFFPLGAMAYSRHVGVERFRRPSLDRAPVDWWRDTLQPLRVSLVGMTLFLVGSCLSLLDPDQTQLLRIWPYAAATVGLFVGERLVYRIYANRIT